MIRSVTVLLALALDAFAQPPHRANHPAAVELFRDRGLGLVNTLTALCHPETMLKSLRESPLASSRSIGTAS